MAEQWLSALAKEIQATAVNPYLKTIYIGGGTPTSLSASQLEQLLCLLDPYRSHIQEYTIEINPETLTEEKADLLRAHGINRASIGFQSSSPALLKMMGRNHDLARMERTIQLLREHAIGNISLDLMYSLPHQTMADLQKSVHDALSFDPDHISIYSLTIEENTVFGKKGMQHLDDDTEADMYEWLLQTLPACGYHQYEISNFAKKGRESMHNKAYWNYRDFYGISMGASGKQGWMRYDHTRSFAEYFKNPCAVTKIPLSREDAMFEMVMMGMRLTSGMDLSLFAEEFGTSFLDVYGDKVKPLIEQGLIVIKDDHCMASPRGLEILNTVLVDLL